MFFKEKKSSLVRSILIFIMVFALFDSDPANQVWAAPQTGESPSGPQACEPGTAWTWAFGASRPEVAQQAQLALKKDGFDASIAANDFGETDSCGNFELFSLDFTVTLKNTPNQQPNTQQEVANRIRATLRQFGKPQLGNVRIDFGSGHAKSYPSSLDIQNSIEGVTTTSDASLSVTASMNKKVFLLVYDPTLANGQDLDTYMGWPAYSTLVQGIVNSFQTASQGQLQYTIAQQVVANEWPQKVDGFRYTETTYFQMWQGQIAPHTPDGVDYDLIIDQYDLCGKLNRGEIDELWLYGAPYFGFYESRLVGPSAYQYNSPPLTSTHNCNKLLPMMGLSYERGVGEAVHSFGHRQEATMTKVYGDWQENRTAHNWDRFGLVKVQSPDYSYSGCGSVHYPPNAQRDYEYDNHGNTLTNCEDFRNYPNLSDPLSIAQPVTCTAWNCNQLDYMVYWFNHLPSYAGASSLSNHYELARGILEQRLFHRATSTMPR